MTHFQNLVSELEECMATPITKAEYIVVSDAAKEVVNN